MLKNSNQNSPDPGALLLSLAKSLSLYYLLPYLLFARSFESAFNYNMPCAKPIFPHRFVVLMFNSGFKEEISWDWSRDENKLRFVLDRKSQRHYGGCVVLKLV